MTLNDSIHYVDGKLHVDAIAVDTITAQHATPLYIYSRKRILHNYQRIVTAYSGLDLHVHYSAKANSNLTLLRTLISAGAGIDVVSGGELYKALHAGCPPEQIVFAGVGKTPEEIRYALEAGIGWFNVENIGELDHIQRLADALGIADVRVALRLNPDVTANTHPYIATGHGGAKFGLTADAVRDVLSRQDDYPRVSIAGLHVHIGSQLGDTHATERAIEKAVELITPHPRIKMVNIGGGMPTAYTATADLPAFDNFAQVARKHLSDYTVFLEPGRAIVADAGILVAQVRYTKYQAGQHIAIVDASMTELLRPMLYQTEHMIVPVHEAQGDCRATQVVGPVCETTDVLGRDVQLPPLSVGATIAILTAGAYGMVMANQYNVRPLPAEVAVTADGTDVDLIRRRQSLQALVQDEMLD